MDYIILIFVCILLCCGNFVFMQYYRNQNTTEFEGINRYIKPLTAKRLSFFCMMIIVTSLMAVYIRYFNADEKLLQLIKQMCCLSILWPAAAIDAKEHIIPNRLLIVGLIYRGCILPMEIFIEPKGALMNIVSETIGAIFIFVFCLVCRLIVKEGICMGDIKLMMCMSLFLGITLIMNVLFVAFFVCFFLAMYCLISKKKTKKDSIAMAPSILAGMLLTLIFIVT